MLVCRFIPVGRSYQIELNGNLLDRLCPVALTMLLGVKWTISKETAWFRLYLVLFDVFCLWGQFLSAL
jgi:hypothetical protein